MNTNQDFKENIGNIILYRNDFLGKGTIKQVVACGFNERYANFMKVIDYPINSEPHAYMVLFSNMQRRYNPKEIKESGDWIIDGELSKKEKKLLGKLIN